MCNFFSIVSNGKGKVFYLDSKARKKIKDSNIEPDSHSSIVQYFISKGQLANKANTENKFNKYEFNP